MTGCWLGVSRPSPFEIVFTSQVQVYFNDDFVKIHSPCEKPNLICVDVPLQVVTSFANCNFCFVKFICMVLYSLIPMLLAHLLTPHT